MSCNETALQKMKKFHEFTVFLFEEGKMLQNMAKSYRGLNLLKPVVKF